MKRITEALSDFGIPLEVRQLLNLLPKGLHHSTGYVGFFKCEAAVGVFCLSLYNGSSLMICGNKDSCDQTSNFFSGLESLVVCERRMPESYDSGYAGYCSVGGCSTETVAGRNDLRLCSSRIESRVCAEFSEEVSPGKWHCKLVRGW